MTERSLLGSLRLDAVLPSILDLSRRLISADAYAIWRYEPQGRLWKIVSAAGLSPDYREAPVPVTDDKNRLLGLITVDDVVDVIQEEATEDVQKMAGAGAEEPLSHRLRSRARHRGDQLQADHPRLPIGRRRLHRGEG